jgi:hypothetical protein
LSERASGQSVRTPFVMYGVEAWPYGIVLCMTTGHEGNGAMDAKPAPRGSWILVAIAVLGTLAVVVAAFALTFDATAAVAKAAGITPGLAWLLPIAVDGAMAVASVSFFALRQRGDRGVYPAIVAGAGALISIWCNGLHATGEAGAVRLVSEERVIVASIPPLMLALAVHLLVELIAALTRKPASSANCEAAELAGASAPLAAKSVPARRRPAASTMPTPASAPTVAAHPQVPASASPASAPRVSLVKPARAPRRQAGRAARAVSPVVEAETIAHLAALRDQCAAEGRRFNRYTVKEEFRVSSNTADAYLKALREASALPTSESSAPNGARA